LNFEVVHQRHAHVRRYQRSGDFEVGREDVTLAVGVRVFRLVDQVGRNDTGKVGVADGAVDAVIAVVQLGFGAQLDTGSDTDRTGRQLIDIRTRDLEVPQAQFGLGTTHHVDADRIQSGLVRRGA